MTKWLFEIRGLAKCHRHGWIRTEILCKMVWSRDSLLSWRPFSCQISVFMSSPLFAHLTETAKLRKKTKKLRKAGQDMGLHAGFSLIALGHDRPWLASWPWPAGHGQRDCCAGGIPPRAQTGNCCCCGGGTPSTKQLTRPPPYMFPSSGQNVSAT